MDSGSLMYDTVNPKLVPCDNLEGWDEKDSGRGVLFKKHMYTYGWFMLMYGKNHHNTIQ